MAIQIQIRRDTTSNWETTNPVLADGELGLDTDLNMLKVGNGVDSWTELSFMAGAGSGEVTPLPSFLEYFTGRDHLPVLNSNFGWDSNGLWFGNAINSNGPGSQQSYPVATNGVFQEFDKVVVTFDMQVDDFCSDMGVCVYPTTEVPNWSWNTDGTRIAAQFNCLNPVIHGMSTTVDDESSGDNLPDPGTYRVVFTYDPSASTEKVVFQTFLINGSQLTQRSRLTLNEAFELNGGTYKIGFASDNSANDEGAENPPHITYISNLTIEVNDGETTLSDSLQNGYSGQILNLVAPLTFTDFDGNDILRIEKSYTGTTRIDALQDDLALRSANDILLYAGDDGPGKVYIGWGNDGTNSFPQNEVATKGYVDEQVGIGSDIKTRNWGYPSDNAIAIMPETDGESIALKSSDAAAIRWHVRNNTGTMELLSATVTPSEGYEVVFTINEQNSVPATGAGKYYQIYCPENSAYDGSFTAVAATTTTLTFYYESDPGVFDAAGATISQPSVYSQFEVDQNGAHVKIADWTSGPGGYSHYWQFKNDGTIDFPSLDSNSRTGYGEVLKFGNSSSQSIISGPNPTYVSPDAQRLVVAGADGTAGDGYDGEGGDVYLWAGQGGGTNGNGGDIKLDGGNGHGTGQGGYVKMRGGYSPNADGGVIQILGGDSYTGNGGDITITGGGSQNGDGTAGGDVNISAGYSSSSWAGGNMTLTTTQEGKITLSGSGGEFLNDSSNPNNQIATIGDVGTKAYVRVNAPASSVGQAGDVATYVADDASYHYYCTGTYDGTTNIWKRVAWSVDTW